MTSISRVFVCDDDFLGIEKAKSTHLTSTDGLNPHRAILLRECKGIWAMFPNATLQRFRTRLITINEFTVEGEGAPVPQTLGERFPIVEK